jgi:hypothetical protein
MEHCATFILQHKLARVSRKMNKQAHDVILKIRLEVFILPTNTTRRFS